MFCSKKTNLGTSAGVANKMMDYSFGDLCCGLSAQGVGDTSLASQYVARSDQFREAGKLLREKKAGKVLTRDDRALIQNAIEDAKLARSKR